MAQLTFGVHLNRINNCWANIQTHKNMWIFHIQSLALWHWPPSAPGYPMLQNEFVPTFEFSIVYKNPIQFKRPESPLRCRNSHNSELLFLKKNYILPTYDDKVSIPIAKRSNEVMARNDQIKASLKPAGKHQIYSSMSGIWSLWWNHLGSIQLRQSCLCSTAVCCTGSPSLELAHAIHSAVFGKHSLVLVKSWNLHCNSFIFPALHSNLSELPHWYSNTVIHCLTSAALWNGGTRLLHSFILASFMPAKPVAHGWWRTSLLPAQVKPGPLGQNWIHLRGLILRKHSTK